MKKRGGKIIDPNLSPQRKIFGSKHCSDLPKCEQHWPLAGWIMIPLRALLPSLALCKLRKMTVCCSDSHTHTHKMARLQWLWTNER